MYNYVRPSSFAAKSAREIEIKFLLTELYGLSIKSDQVSLLDVGFAGAGYIEPILEFGNIDYTGLDGDSKRIQGEALLIPERSKKHQSKEKWRNLLNKIKYIEANILDYDSDVLYDIVISISAIEHIVAMGYNCNNEFDLFGDIRAVDRMKKLVKKDGHLLLTFPCGKERILSPEENFRDKLKDTPLENKWIRHRYRALIYNEDRIGMLIGDWKVVKERYWTDSGKGFEECEKTVACAVEQKSSDQTVRSQCALLLKLRFENPRFQSRRDEKSLLGLDESELTLREITCLKTGQ